MDHVINWRSHEYPIEAFFDLENIQFSHLGCNAAASDKTNAIAAKRRITHCPRGHVYDEANTLVYRGKRRCRICIKSYKKKYVPEV